MPWPSAPPLPPQRQPSTSSTLRRTSSSPSTTTTSHPSSRPARIPWLQLLLRINTLLAALTALVLALYVTISRHVTWGTVFLSVAISLIPTTLEILALGTRYVPLPRLNLPFGRSRTSSSTPSSDLEVGNGSATKKVEEKKKGIIVPRIHPGILIALDAAAVALMVWSFFVLFFDAYGIDTNKRRFRNRPNRFQKQNPQKNEEPYPASPFNIVETYFAVIIGSHHTLLILFTLIDILSIRRTIKTPERVLEISSPFQPTDRETRRMGVVGGVGVGMNPGREGKRGMSMGRLGRSSRGKGRDEDELFW